MNVFLCLRFQRQAKEWGKYEFRSCADVKLVSSISIDSTQCSDHGTWVNGQCDCDRYFTCFFWDTMFNKQGIRSAKGIPIPNLCFIHLAFPLLLVAIFAMRSVMYTRTPTNIKIDIS